VTFRRNVLASQEIFATKKNNNAYYIRTYALECKSNLQNINFRQEQLSFITKDNKIFGKESTTSTAT